MVKSYEDSMKVWFRRRLESEKHGYLKPDMVDWGMPVEPYIEHEEGYCYSEYTQQDPSTTVGITYYPKDGDYPRSHVLGSDNDLNKVSLSDLIKEVLAISVEDD
jgi:hypothetical protein